jgi:hypothetical protein
VLKDDMCCFGGSRTVLKGDKAVQNVSATAVTDMSDI